MDRMNLPDVIMKLVCCYLVVEASACADMCKQPHSQQISGAVFRHTSERVVVVPKQHQADVWFESKPREFIVGLGRSPLGHMKPEVPPRGMHL